MKEFSNLNLENKRLTLQRLESLEDLLRICPSKDPKLYQNGKVLYHLHYESERVVLNYVILDDAMTCAYLVYTVNLMKGTIKTLRLGIDEITKKEDSEFRQIIPIIKVLDIVKLS